MRPSTPPPRSATTASRWNNRGTSHPILLRTGHPRSVRHGSSKDSGPEISVRVRSLRKRASGR
jgi:hypothetical protein